MTPPNFGLQYRHGSHRGPTPPMHCRQCGRSMQISVETDRYQPFDAETGERRFERHTRCSRPWWAAFTGFHDHGVEDAHGDWPWI